MEIHFKIFVFGQQQLKFHIVFFMQNQLFPNFLRCQVSSIYAEVVTFVAGSLEAGGLPGYPEVLMSLK